MAKEKKCVYCGSCSELTIDLYIPASHGGKVERTNQVIACHSCNNKKGEMLPLDFIVKRINDDIKHCKSIGQTDKSQETLHTC